MKKLKKHIDERGWLVEVLRGDEINEKIEHIHFSILKPGFIRGGHYHKRKTEWFCIVKGKVKLILNKLNSNEKKEIMLSDNNPMIVKITPHIRHTIENIGTEDVYLIAIVNEVFNPNDPDTYT